MSDSMRPSAKDDEMPLKRWTPQGERDCMIRELEAAQAELHKAHEWLDSFGVVCSTDQGEVLSLMSRLKSLKALRDHCLAVKIENGRGAATDEPRKGLESQSTQPADLGSVEGSKPDSEGLQCADEAIRALSNEQIALRLLLPTIAQGVWNANRYDTDDSMVLKFWRDYGDEPRALQFDTAKHQSVCQLERVWEGGEGECSGG